MATLLIVLAIVICIILCYNRYKQEQIVGLSHEEILEKHRHALAVYRGWLVFAVILFVGGYLLAKCYPMYETEDYEYWLFGTQKGTREVLTAFGWWSYILRLLGVFIGIPSLIGFFDRWKAVRKYENMSLSEYSDLQQKTQADINKQDREAKEAKRGRTIGKIIGKIISGGY